MSLFLFCCVFLRPRYVLHLRYLSPFCFSPVFFKSVKCLNAALERPFFSFLFFWCFIGPQERFCLRGYSVFFSSCLYVAKSVILNRRARQRRRREESRREQKKKEVSFCFSLLPFSDSHVIYKFCRLRLRYLVR